MVTDGPPECAEPADLPVLHGCATIRLTRGQNTLIDATDHGRLADRKWFALPVPSRPTHFQMEYP